MGTYTAKTRTVGRRPRSKRLRELGGSVSIIGGGTSESGGSYAPLIHSHEMEEVAGLEAAMAGFSQQLGEKASTSYVTGQIANISGALQAFQLIRNLVTAISSESTDDQYPSAKLLYDKLAALANVYAAISHTHISSEISDLATVLANYVTSTALATALANYEQTSNKVAAVDANSTDDQYPTAKLFYDTLQLTDAYLANLDARLTSLENDPPVTYIIRGTSSNVGGTETFRVRFIAKGSTTPAPYQNITVNVDAYGVWQIKYVNKYLYALDSFASNKPTLLTIDFSNADDLNSLTTLLDAFNGCTSLTSADFSGRFLTAVTSTRRTFNGCISLINLTLDSAIFASVEDTRDFIRGCTALTALDLRNATLEKATNLGFMFGECSSITTIDLSSATFAAAQDMRGFCYNNIALSQITFGVCDFSNLIALSGDAAATYRGAFQGCSSLANITAFAGQQLNNLQFARDAFNGCTSLTSIDLSSATFNSLVVARDMFYGCSALTSIDLSSATFANATNVRELFRGCAALITIQMDVATFAAVEDSRAIMVSCSSLSTIMVPGNSTAILPTSTAATAPMDLHYSQYLTYASMMAVANWLSDLTGYSAHTITFNTTAWNALTAAEQSNIDTILSSKNWTRVLSN